MALPSIPATIEALRRKPIFLLWLKECRSAIIALCIHTLFMTVLLGPIVRVFVPKPKAFLGVIRTSHDSYPDVMRWLDLVLWPAGWALVGAFAKNRVKPTIERAKRESEDLSVAAERAARDGDLERSILLFSQAEALSPDPERRAQVLARLREQQSRRTVAGPLPSGSSPGGIASGPGGGIGPGGRIRLVGRLGQGAMGTVHLGEDVVLGRRVAVKELAGPLATVPEVRERFLREARALAQISSPHVVQVFDLFQEGDRQFLSMELCEGEDLAARIRREGRLPAGEAARLAAQIAAALVAAHGRGVIHRDLKPSNVLFAGSDVKVADFGLARTADSAMTQEGAVMGTPYYMAPEQTRGAAVDARADLYALGCVLFEMLTGRPPYSGTVQEVLLAHVSPAPPPTLESAGLQEPGDFGVLVSRLLAKDPAARPQSAQEAAEALRALARFEGPTPTLRSQAAS
ncbi:MAG TPA: serine/threonine-protein kinase [Candidatus Polarisedimenticolia bacterium]|nr:serine/threonine-protein kinase [Candidatus Polarisedimenticolia bacterium]